MSIWSQLSELAQRAFDPGRAPTDVGGMALAGCDCGPDPGDVDFTAAIVGLGAKLAKADGLVTTDELNVFVRVFRTPARDQAAMRRVFDIARQTVLGYESYAKRIARKYHDRPCLLEGVLDGLFQVAVADGVVTADELDYLKSVSDTFGFSDKDFRRIKASHMGVDSDDPYAVLGLQPDASFEAVRVAYRQLMRENHPDTVVSFRSAPREFGPIAHDKAAAINTAYARIRAEHGFMARAD